MFSIEQSVENKSSKNFDLQPYGIIARHGEPDVIGFFILHEVCCVNDRRRVR